MCGDLRTDAAQKISNGKVKALGLLEGKNQARGERDVKKVLGERQKIGKGET